MRLHIVTSNSILLKGFASITLRDACHVQVAEAQEAAQEAKELVQEQTAVANAVRRQAEESKSEAGPLLRQAEQNEQQVRPGLLNTAL